MRGYNFKAFLEGQPIQQILLFLPAGPSEAMRQLRLNSTLTPTLA